MKHIIYTLILLFSINSLAQQIVPLETKYTTNFLARDTYFKDVNGELDKFIGTWKYEDATTSTVFEITFYKEENVSSIHNCTFDRLNANFKLTINNVEQYNTYTNDYGKMFMGGSFYNSYIYDPAGTGDYTIVAPSVNRYHLAIVEPGFIGFLHSSDLTIIYESELGLEKLYWKNDVSVATLIATGQQINIYQMPLEMVLIKQ